MPARVLLALALTSGCSGSSDAPARPLDPRARDTASGDTSHDDSGAPPWWESDAGDIDGDGVSASQGDCDETRADVHPGVADATCDAVDDDCDGVADDEAPRDAQEPDDDAPHALGDLGEEGEALLVATAFPEGDVDAVTFHVTDGDWAVFDVEAWLYDVPEGVDLALELTWDADADGAYRGVVARADDLGAGGDEFLDWEGSSWEDDSGWYTLRVSGAGADCGSSYLLQLLVGSW